MNGTGKVRLREGGLGGGQGPQVPDPPPKTQSTKSVTIALIGGSGVMGQWFRRFFEGQGHKVLVADLDTPDEYSKALAGKYTKNDGN